MIEVIDAQRCTSCDICVNVCPTNVFDKTDGIPVIARQGDCQTCFLCELYCPEDALFVSPFAEAPQQVDLEVCQRDRGASTLVDKRGRTATFQTGAAGTGSTDSAVGAPHRERALGARHLSEAL